MESIDAKLLQLMDNLQSRVLGLDMCLKGVALMYVLDSDSVDNQQRRATILKEMLTSLRQNMVNEPFMAQVNHKSFFSSIDSLINSIDNVEQQLIRLQSTQSDKENANE